MQCWWRATPHKTLGNSNCCKCPALARGCKLFFIVIIIIIIILPSYRKAKALKRNRKKKGSTWDKKKFNSWICDDHSHSPNIIVVPTSGQKNIASFAQCDFDVILVSASQAIVIRYSTLPTACNGEESIHVAVTVYIVVNCHAMNTLFCSLRDLICRFFSFHSYFQWITCHLRGIYSTSHENNKYNIPVCIYSDKSYYLVVIT